MNILHARKKNENPNLISVLNIFNANANINPYNNNFNTKPF